MALLVKEMQNDQFDFELAREKVQFIAGAAVRGLRDQFAILISHRSKVLRKIRRVHVIFHRRFDHCTM